MNSTAPYNSRRIMRTRFREGLVKQVLGEEKLYRTQIEEKMSVFGIGVRTVQLLLQYLRKKNQIGYDGKKYYNLTDGLTEDDDE